MYPIFKIVEALIAFQLGHYGSFKPDLDIVKDLYGYCNLPLPEFTKALKSKKIQLFKDEVNYLTNKNSIVLNFSPNKEIPCDLLICGTGFSKKYSSYFDEDLIKKLNIQDDGLYLYRHILPTNISNLAFCGSEIATVSNIGTHAIQATWITKYIKNEIVKPSMEDMNKEINETMNWKRNWMPFTNSRANIILLHQIQYHDLLLKDMKINHKRKGNWLKECFYPYKPSDYSKLE